MTTLLAARFRPWLLPAALALLAVAGQPFAQSWRWDRAAILAGEGWRLATGNLVHLGPAHLALNLAGLALVAALFAAAMSLTRWTLCAVGAGLAVGVGLLLFNPELRWYVGLSGLLHGLFLAGALAVHRREPGFARLALAAGLAKLAWEQVAGPLPGSAETAGGAVIVDAHLYGAAGGLLVWLAARGVEALRGRATGSSPAD